MKNKKIGIFLLVLFILGFPMKQVNAEIGELPPGMIIGDNDGIFVEKSGIYFIDIRDIQPANSYKKEITIMNTEKDKPYKLSFQIAPAINRGPLKLDQEIATKIYLNETIIYDGNLTGLGKVNLQAEPYPLGTFAYGDKALMRIEMVVNDKLIAEDFIEKSSSKMNWSFYAIKDEKGKLPNTSETGASSNEGGYKLPGWLPQTGEEWRNLLYQICAGLFLVMLALLLTRHRKENNA